MIVIGVDMGGTKVLAAAVDEAGHIVTQDRVDTLAQEGPEAVIARIARLLTDVAAQARTPLDEIAAVTVGVPGRVDDRAGVVSWAPNLPGWREIPLAHRLSEHLGGRCRVFLDNDVNMAVLGEHAYGAGRGLRSVVGVYVGTGIGGGLIIDGKLIQGERGAAAEVGHTIIDVRGPRCPCGQRGCVEVLASRTAMERDVRERIADGKKSVVPKLMKKRDKVRMTSSIIQLALDDGDKVMRGVFRRAQRYLG